MKSPLRIPPQGLAVCAVALAFHAVDAPAAEPGWASQVLVSPPVRAQVESTPIPLRPYRPFHFYGNTVRRMHYRGTPIPSASDFWQAARVLSRQPYVPVESLLPNQDAQASESLVQPDATGSFRARRPADAARLEPPEPSTASPEQVGGDARSPQDTTTLGVGQPATHETSSSPVH